MKNYETVLVEKRGAIGIATLNRTDAGNRFNLQLSQDLSSAIEELAADEEVRVIIIRANGSNFSVGVDISFALDAEKGVLEIASEFEPFAQMQWRIFDTPKPVISAVQGMALAGGAGVAVRSDFTIMAEDAEIGFVAINVGLSCMRAIPTLTRIVGWKKAMELVMTGETIKAQEALALGLVNKVVPRDKLDEAAIELANKLLSKSPLALAVTKRVAAATVDMTLRQADEYITLFFEVLADSKDGREGVSAFVEKRAPQWKYKGVPTPGIL